MEFAIAERIKEPKLTFANWIAYFGVALLVTAIPCYLFYSVKDLDLLENYPLYIAVYLGASLLLTVAYHAFAVFGARKYRDRSDVLSKQWAQDVVDKKVNAVLAMGRTLAFAIVNAAYILTVFVASFPRFFGRFETSTFVTLTT